MPKRSARNSLRLTERMGMSQTDDFAHERRARLAAERLLESKQAELFKANQKLERHARSLSNEIIVKREPSRHDR
jgi:hypothetical protein